MYEEDCANGEEGCARKSELRSAGHDALFSPNGFLSSFEICDVNCVAQFDMVRWLESCKQGTMINVEGGSYRAGILELSLLLQSFPTRTRQRTCTSCDNELHLQNQDIGSIREVCKMVWLF
jgi:hypothetical protein